MLHFTIYTIYSKSKLNRVFKSKTRCRTLEHCTGTLHWNTGTIGTNVKQVLPPQNFRFKFYSPTEGCLGRYILRLPMQHVIILAPDSELSPIQGSHLSRGQEQGAHLGAHPTSQQVKINQKD